jgi:hypothetical protein
MTEKALDSAMMFYGSSNNNSSDATVFIKIAYRDVLELDDEYEGQTGHIVITSRTSKVNAAYSVLISLIAMWGHESNTLIIIFPCMLSVLP